MDRLARNGDCDTHGQRHDGHNLFIADGSQFTCSATGNPTWTIVALALALTRYQPATPPSLRWSDPPR